jgi:hypothetical protein
MAAADERTGAAASPPAAGDGSPSRAERELLLAAARVEERTGDAPADAIDWTRLLDAAVRHRMIPLLHRHLRDAAIPPGAAAELARRNRAEAHRAIALSAELRRLAAALEAAGIATLAYKGPALAMLAYGDLSLRSYADLDLVVLPSDIPRALAVLDDAGYAPGLHFSPAQERYFRRVDGDYPLLHRRTALLVELHARVSSERFCMPISTAELMRRAQPVHVGGAAVRTLGDDDLLLVLCVHGAKHRWKRLEWLASVAALLRAGRGDVAAVLARASEVHARRTVLLGLALAHRLLAAPVPAEAVREAEGDAGIGALADEAERRMFDGGADEGEEAPANLAFNLRARDGAMDRARYAGRWLFGPTPEDWRWARLPDPLFPLYRVLRPVRLLVRHGRRWG